ncbi:ferredoxin [Clavibacter michiganensis]|uniref:ferredoxin n=1 Tax=Clavibacter michiganensis TaxID=28447 RepID=UPI00292EA1F8|nr:ferredoxin [Clavibacter michiganensis]
MGRCAHSSVPLHIDFCQGAGVCARAAPSVLDRNADVGVVVVLDRDPPAELDDAVREAAARCPAAVIRLQAPCVRDAPSSSALPQPE